ncbi:MAG: InlB B-repeat-containing protein [Firmicutes bacterium]|nr:InlB B-repeat-containing protein [Bacillota bacterium]
MFGGWFTDPCADKKFDFDTAIKEDTILYAKWSAATYKVSFDGNGIGMDIGTQIIEHGQTATDPGEMSAEGFTFGGWYEDPNCTVKFDFSTPEITPYL